MHMKERTVWMQKDLHLFLEVQAEIKLTGAVQIGIGIVIEIEIEKEVGTKTENRNTNGTETEKGVGEGKEKGNETRIGAGTGGIGTGTETESGIGTGSELMTGIEIMRGVSMKGAVEMVTVGTGNLVPIEVEVGVSRSGSRGIPARLSPTHNGASKDKAPVSNHLANLKDLYGDGGNNEGNSLLERRPRDTSTEEVTRLGGSTWK